MITVTLTIDTAPFEAALAELSALVEAADLSAESLCRFIRLIDTGSELFCIDGEGLAAGRAGEIVYRAQPSELVLGLLAAFRAGNPDLAALEERFGLHGRSPSRPGDSHSQDTSDDAAAEPGGGSAAARMPPKVAT